MNDQDQYGRYMAQQPQQIHSNQNDTTNGNRNGNYNGFDNNQPYPGSDYAQSSTGFASQQQVMYGEYAGQGQHREGEYRGYEEYGAHEYYAGSGEKLRPLPPRRRHASWLWYIFIPMLIFFLAGGLFGMRSFSDKPVMQSYGWPVGKGEHHDFQKFGQPLSDTFSQTYEYNGSTLQMNINDNNGSVSIDSNADVQQLSVNVQALDGQNENVPVKFDSGSGQLTFDGVQPGPGYNIVIEVPGSVQNVNMQVRDGSGDVSVSGISGQVNLRSQDGSIELSQDTLSGQSSIQTQNGSIDFQGSLSQQGNYTFETDTGSINLELPSDVSFQLVNPSNNVHNEFNSNSTGNSPRPSLNVSSQSGDIDITPGQ